MKIQPYEPPTIRPVPRELSVNQQRKYQNRTVLSSSKSSSDSERFRRISISSIEKRQKSLNAEEHSKKDQQKNISNISYAGTESRITADRKESFASELSKTNDTNISAKKKTFSVWNPVSNKNDKLSLGNVDDMKHHSKKKKDRWQRLIKWFWKPSRMCCLILLCLLIAAIPIAILFGLRSRQTNKSLTCKTVLTFENLANQTKTTVVNGYGGLNWWNIGTLVAIHRSNGYRAAMVSPSCVTYNPDALTGLITPSITGTTFSLVSFYVSAAWLNETNLTIIGSRSGVQLYSTNVMIFMINVTLVILNWADVDNVTFTAFSPAINNLTWYSMDNLCLG